MLLCLSVLASVVSSFAYEVHHDSSGSWVKFQSAELAEKRLFVYDSDLRTVRDTVTSIAREQGPPLVVLNASYFWKGKPVTYTRSSLRQTQGGVLKDPPARACFVWSSKVPAATILQGDSTMIPFLLGSPDLEVACAGPRLIAGGKLVFEEAYCKELFNPACRDDHWDPGLSYAALVPRSGICTTVDHDLILFAVSAASISGFAEFMAKQGCTDAMNLDGGGSTQLFVRGASPGQDIWREGEKRKVPVWLVLQ